MKRILSVVIPFALALAVGACGGGYSTQEATDACNEERERNTAMDDSSFAACVACFEDCTDCVPLGTSPETFACPDDLEDAASEETSEGE